MRNGDSFKQARSLAVDGAGFNAVLLGPCTRAFLLTTDWIMSDRSLTPSVLVGESCPL